MQSFTQYIVENKDAIHSHLAVEKLITMIGDAHVDKYSNALRVNLGSAIHDSSFSNTDIIFTTGSEFGVKVGKMGNSSAILITLTKLPPTTDLRSTLASKEVYSALKDTLPKVIDRNSDDKHESEKRREVNTETGFEDLYDSLVAVAKKIVVHHESALGELENQRNGNSHRPGSEDSYSLAVKHTMSEITDFPKFMKSLKSKASKEWESVNLLTSDNKKKLNSRLTSFHNRIKREFNLKNNSD